MLKTNFVVLQPLVHLMRVHMTSQFTSQQTCTQSVTLLLITQD